MASVDVEIAVLREELRAHQDERARERDALDARIRRQQKALDILDDIAKRQAMYIGLLKGMLESAGYEVPAAEDLTNPPSVIT